MRKSPNLAQIRAKKETPADIVGRGSRPAFLAEPRSDSVSITYGAATLALDSKPISWPSACRPSSSRLSWRLSSSLLSFFELP